MILTKRNEIYLKVKVEEELPDKTISNSVFVGYNHNDDFRNKDVLMFQDIAQRWQDANEGYSQGRRFPDFWLKPIKQVYVLTKDDLVKLLHDHLDDEFWQTPEDFIESITSQ